jgi:ankyrin repeat protein
MANVFKGSIETLRESQLSCVKVLLAAGADPNVGVDAQGATALFRACQRGATESVRALLKAGADATVRLQPGGLHLLYIACFGGHIEIIQSLCEEAAADVNELTDQFSFTALSEHKGTIWARCRLPLSALATKRALCIGVVPAAQEGHTDVIKYLHGRGAKPDVQNQNGATALFFSSKFNRLETVEYMLRVMGADPNSGDAGAASALFGAAENGHIGIAKVLLQAGADINAAKANGASALLVAAEAGRDELLNVLLDHGADTVWAPPGRLNGLRVFSE